MVEPIDIYNGQPGITDTTLFTAPTGMRVKVISAVVANDTDTSTYISVHRAPYGIAAGDTNIIINRKPVGSRESVALWELVGQVLEAGDFLSAIAEVADQLTVHISGVRTVV